MELAFKEAETVFDDALAYIFDDVWHSDTEPRELIIGQSNTSRLLIVAFIEKKQNIIRIISARKATNQEKIDYERNRTFTRIYF